MNRLAKRPKSSIIVDDFTHKIPAKSKDQSINYDEIEGFDYISAL